MDINGTLVWYYCICKREVWLMSHNIIPDQKDTNIDIGRFIHESSYNRNKKEIHFGSTKFDVLMRKGNKMIIGETKKSSKFETASKYQLLFYLKVLEDAGIEAKGVLLYPEERKRIDVELTEAERSKLDEIIKHIITITEMEKPPKVEKNKYCNNCGYKEYCYA